MNTTHTIQNLSVGDSAVSITTTSGKSFVISGQAFNDSLRRVSLPVNDAVILAMPGVCQFSAEIIDVKEGDEFVNTKTGATEKYRKDQSRIVGYELGITNPMDVALNINRSVVDVMVAMKGLETKTFVPKANAIGRSLIPQKPVVQDSAVEESAPEPVANKKPAQKALETAEQ